MDHFCRFCRRVRANEKFSGRGHRQHICQDCQRRPRAERDRIERFDELHGFLRQSVISKKNQLRLTALSQHADGEIRSLAALLQEIARVHPGRRRRIKTIARDNWPLFVRMAAQFGDEWWTEYFAQHFDDHGSDWLWERYAAAKFAPYGQAPCWCGSGVAYWDCCADRDEAAAQQFLSTEASPADSAADEGSEGVRVIWYQA